MFSAGSYADKEALRPVPESGRYTDRDQPIRRDPRWPG